MGIFVIPKEFRESDSFDLFITKEEIDTEDQYNFFQEVGYITWQSYLSACQPHVALEFKDNVFGQASFM